MTLARPNAPPGAPLRDFEAYYAAGQTWTHGADPYGAAIWHYENTLPGVDARRYELLPFVGPPAALPLWAAFARLPYDAAATVWRAVLVLSIFALIWIAAMLGGVRRTPVNLFALAIAALGFGAMTSAFSLGQVALPVAAAIAAAFAATRFGGKVLGATAAFAQPNLVFALAGEFRRKSGALAMLSAAVLFALLCASVNAKAIFHYAQVLLSHGTAEQFSAIQLTPTAVTYGFGAPAGTALAAGGATAILAALVWLAAMIKLEDRLTLFIISSALVPFGSAFFHQHDLVIVFVPAVALALRAPTSTAPAAMAGALLCATNWVGLAQYPGGAVQTALLTGAFALALLAVRDELAYRTAVAPAAVVLLIALAGIVTRTHAMPVWPDAMGELLPTGNSAAGIWRAEQAATGLFARDAFWALLRCLPLTGCALLVYAAALNSRYLAGSRTSVAVRD